MNNDKIIITDELIACYLEGNLTEEERSVVEAYLDENEEAMEEVLLARAALAYQECMEENPSVFAKSMIDHDEYALAADSDNMDCAIKAQQMVLRNYGVEVSIEELTALARKNGWFVEGKGSAFDFVGELLNHYGVEAVQMRNAGIYHIMHELSQGHKIIVGVDADNEEAQSKHVMLVAGIDTTDPDNLKVTVKDPSHSEKDQVYDAKDFMQRWNHTGCFMVSTKQAAPLSANPEMANFDYQLGYVRKFADVAYEEIIKRLAEDGYLVDKSSKSKVRSYLFGCLLFALLGCAAYFIWRLSTPYTMRVNITPDEAYRIDHLPLEKGKLICEYADNALQSITLTSDTVSVSLNDIPYKYKDKPVHIRFEAEGYQTIDTLVPVQRALSLSIRRNNDLGLVFGNVLDVVTCQPVAGAIVTLQGLTVLTDTAGQFRIEIPFEKQDTVQTVTVTKEGYELWKGTNAPSSSVSWNIPLNKIMD